MDSSDKSQVRLGDEVVDAIKKKIDALIEQEGIYRNPALTLTQFAEQVEASRHDVSWVINNVYEQSFYDFINKQRIADFKRRVTCGEFKKMTILGLALESGFNSKATFNRVL